MPTDTLFVLALIGFVALLAQLLAWAVRLPAILPLLLAGIAMGPLTGWVQPDQLFGELLFPFVSLSVAIILFDGALSLRFKDISGHGKVVTRLISVGMLVTFVLISLASWWLLGLDRELAILVGAVSVVTGPTVIAPLLRVARPTRGIDQILRWEGILIDPLGAILAVIAFKFVLSSRETSAVFDILGDLGLIVAIGLGLGVFSAWLFVQFVRRAWLPRTLHNFAMLALVLFSYAGAEQLAHESGLLVVTVMGIWLANYGELDLEEISAFKEVLSVILLSAIFILLAARLDIPGLLSLGWPLVVFLVLVQFVIRPLAVFFSTLGQAISWRERLALGWIAPRGIVAAAVSSLFAIDLMERGFDDAKKVVALVFAIILGTVILQSLTASAVLGLLRVRRPPANGVLIVGANRLARELGLLLHSQGFPVLVADPVWENYRQARMAGLPAYYGVPQSEQAELALDLGSMAVVLALSSSNYQNALAVYHFSHLFGEERVFALRSSPEEGGVRRASALFRRRQLLFGADLGHSAMSQRLMQGWELKAVGLDEGYGLSDMMARYRQEVVPLLLLSEEPKRIRPCVDGLAESDYPYTLIALVNPSSQVADTSGVEPEDLPPS